MKTAHCGKYVSSLLPGPALEVGQQQQPVLSLHLPTKGMHVGSPMSPLTCRSAFLLDSPVHGGNLAYFPSPGPLVMGPCLVFSEGSAGVCLGLRICICIGNGRGHFCFA
jgi:hypothetical protein